MSFFEKSLLTLELPAVLNMLAGEAVSEPAKELALALRPSVEEAEVRRRLSETTAAKTMMVVRGSPSFSGVKDVRASLARADLGGALNTRELLDIARVLQCARLVRGYLADDSVGKTPIDYLFSALHANRFLEEKITGSIVGEEEIADAASSDLANIRRQMRAAAARAREALQKIISSPSYAKVLQEPIITLRSDRYVVPVKAEHKGAINGLVHDISASGATLFVEPMAAVKANNELRELAAKERAEIDRILAELSADCAEHREGITTDFDLLVRLDLIFAKAKLSYKLNCEQATLEGKGIVLRRARHPLLDQAKAVPIDVELGDSFDTLVITGPNTGGKTVTLKTVGLLSLMAQAGLQIPAAYGSELSIFDEIFADIGDEQSIEQSLSTFSSHMTNIVEILQSVTPRSLALFDELGAGTDPTEGAALAMAILNHLLDMKVTTMATTHYSELKAFALGTKGVENASVEFNVETLQPTYRLSIGVPGKSNAFEISRKLGLPEFLIEDAGNRLSKDAVRFEDVIANAEYHRQIAEKERELAEQAHRETQKLRDEAEKLQKELAARRETELRKAKQEARQLLQKAQRESEQIISDLKKQRREGVKEHELHNLRAQLQSAIDDTGEKIAAGEDEGGPVTGAKVGDTVLLTNLNAKAVILTEPDAKGECTVQAGALKLKANIADMRTARPDKPEKPRGRQPAKGSGGSAYAGIAPREVQTECDVRGMNLEEALLAVDMFLDGAVLNKLGQVYIIHGKGTGVLRSGIQQHLKKHPAVKGFRLGKYGEGEDGVTVAQLK